MYDVIIIGGGLAGLFAGNLAVRAGLKTALLSAGKSSLHFASGSIDLWASADPFADIKKLPQNHPYKICGEANIHEAFADLAAILDSEDLPYTPGASHERFTATGTKRTTYFSPRSVYNEGTRQALKQSLAVLNFQDNFGFHPEIFAKNLAARFHATIHTIPAGLESANDGSLTDVVADFARSVNADTIFLPAMKGDRSPAEAIAGKSGKFIMEIPVLPPVPTGIRLENALLDHFIRNGGMVIAGRKVTGAQIHKRRVSHITTDNGRDYMAENFVLATGSYLSGGISSDFDTISEGLFGLDTTGIANEHDRSFFRPQPFMTHGVVTDSSLRGQKNGQTIENLFCAGSIIAGGNPLEEGSGGGVSLATARTIAGRIIHG